MIIEDVIPANSMYQLTNTHTYVHTYIRTYVPTYVHAIEWLSTRVFYVKNVMFICVYKEETKIKYKNL